MGADERTSVNYAIAANAAVLVVKTAAGLLSGSSSLLAEAAHSTQPTS